MRAHKERLDVVDIPFRQSKPGFVSARTEILLTAVPKFTVFVREHDVLYTGLKIYKKYLHVCSKWVLVFCAVIVIVLLYLTLQLFSCRENKDFAINVKIPSPSAGSGRPATSPKELSSPRRPASRKGLERSATQTEIIKKESQARNVHLVSKKMVVKAARC